MPSLLHMRDIGDLASVPDTLSSWDNCMSKAWCKWPVIVGIVVGSLIALSLIWCIARCLCCGLECCCGICACCNACCPSPRRKDKGYHPAPPTPYQQPYNASQQTYQSHPRMDPHFATGAAGYRGASVPQTATFESPSKPYNADALPAMPSWSNASSRRIEQHDQDEVELEKFVEAPAASSPLSPTTPHSGMYGRSRDQLGHNQYYGQQETGSVSAIGVAQGNYNHPYLDYPQHPSQDQFSQSPYGGQHGNYSAGGPISNSPYPEDNLYHSNVSFPNHTYDHTNAMASNSPVHNYNNPIAGGYPAGARSPSPFSYAETYSEHYQPVQQQPTGYSQPAAYVQPKPYEANPSIPPSALTPGRRPADATWREV